MDQLLKDAQNSNHKDNKSKRDELIEQLEKDIIKYCYFTATRPEIAQEVCQETLIKVMEDISTFTSYRHLVTWSLRVAKNSHIDFIRKKQNSDLNFPDFNQDDFAGDEQDIDHTLDIMKSLSKLEPEERHLLTLVDIEGHSYQEASQVLDITESALRSRLHKIRKKFIEIHRNE